MTEIPPATTRQRELAEIATPTRVVNLYRERYDVYIGRAGRGQDGYFGNPYTVREWGHRALERFELYFAQRVENDPEFRRRVLELRGKTLGCFCVKADGSGDCHGKIIVAWLERNA